MNCCCTNTLRLCDINYCNGRLVLPGTAAKNGVYVMELDWLDSKLGVERGFSPADELTFPVNDLCENFTYQGRLIDPDGDLVTFSANSQEYDCFQFRTRIVWGGQANQIIPDTGILFPVIFAANFTSNQDGLTAVVLLDKDGNSMIGNEMVQVELEIKPLRKDQWNWDPATGILTLLDGITVDDFAQLAYLYKKLVAL